MTGEKTVNILFKECGDYISELRSHCVNSMFSREYSWNAKHPFKVMSFVNAMNWRMTDFAESALLLLKQNKIVPSLCIIRACWENMAATYELKCILIDCCDKQVITDNVDSTLMRLLYSNRLDKGNRFISEEHYDVFKEYKAKSILTLVQKIEKDYPETKDFYSNICEFVHPNGDGVCGSYSYLNEETHSVQFYPQFTQESNLFQAFIVTLSCSIMLYLRFIDSIKDSLKEFTDLCERSLQV